MAYFSLNWPLVYFKQILLFRILLHYNYTIRKSREWLISRIRTRKGVVGPKVLTRYCFYYGHG